MIARERETGTKKTRHKTCQQFGSYISHDLLVQNLVFGPQIIHIDFNIISFTTTVSNIRQHTIKFSSDFYVPLRMNYNSFVDHFLYFLLNSQ